MMNRNIKIFLCTVAVILLSTGCSQIYDQHKSLCPDEQPVAIIASIDNANVRTGVETRTGGTVDPDGEEGWEPEKVGSLDFERTIHHVFLFVYKKGVTTPYKVFFYYTGSSNPLNEISNLDARPLNIAPGSPSSFTMELELLSGYYNFVMLVNSEAAVDKMRTEKKIDHPEQLVEQNKILTSDDLKGTHRKYFPMVGQHELYVPDQRKGSATNRMELSPDIKLERVHACVEFILDTVDENKPGIFFSPILEKTKVTGLELLNEQNQYTVMPSANDYTVTGLNNTAPIRAIPLGNNPLDPKRETYDVLNIHEANGFLKKFYNRLLPYVSDYDWNKKYTYVAPATWATTLDQCLTIKFSVRFPGDTEDTDYIIPLTNPRVDGNAQFVTRRNTVYRVRAKLKGREISVVDYEVIDWTNQNVDIPW